MLRLALPHFRYVGTFKICCDNLDTLRSGVIHVGMSDHSLAYAVWEVRDYKYCRAEYFLWDLA